MGHMGKFCYSNSKPRKVTFTRTPKGERSFNKDKRGKRIKANLARSKQDGMNFMKAASANINNQEYEESDDCSVDIRVNSGKYRLPDIGTEEDEYNWETYDEDELDNLYQSLLKKAREGTLASDDRVTSVSVRAEIHSRNARWSTANKRRTSPTRSPEEPPRKYIGTSSVTSGRSTTRTIPTPTSVGVNVRHAKDSELAAAINTFINCVNNKRDSLIQIYHLEKLAMRNSIESESEDMIKGAKLAYTTNRDKWNKNPKMRDDYIKLLYKNLKEYEDKMDQTYLKLQQRREEERRYRERETN
jgi:hypothetical protein